MYNWEVALLQTDIPSGCREYPLIQCTYAQLKLVGKCIFASSSIKLAYQMNWECHWLVKSAGTKDQLALLESFTKKNEEALTNRELLGLFLQLTQKISRIRRA